MPAAQGLREGPYGSIGPASGATDLSPTFFGWGGKPLLK